MSETMFWSNILPILCQSNHRDSKTKSCLRLLDSIIVDASGKISWYFTTKNGIISKKKDSKTSSSAILERFNSFALANPCNTENFIAVILDVTGKRRNIDVEELENILNCTPKSSFNIQVYLRPKQGLNIIYIGAYENQNCEENGIIDFFYRNDSNQNNLNTIMDQADKSVMDQMSEYLSELVSILENNNKTQITKLIIEFILDDNNHIWLSFIPLLEAVTSPSRHTRHPSMDGTPFKRGSVSLDVLEGLARLSHPDNEEPSKKSSTNKVDPMNSTIPTDKIDTSFNSTIKSLLSTPKNTDQAPRRPSSIGNNELIIREGRTIRCVLGPPEIPGLLAWVAESVAEDKVSVWKVDIEKYVSPIALPYDEVNDHRTLSRGESRHAESRNSLAMSLLLDNEFVTLLLPYNNNNNKNIPTLEFHDEVSFINEWLRLIQKVKNNNMRSSSAATEFTVCGNCFAILKKIESIAEYLESAYGMKVENTDGGTKDTESTDTRNRSQEMRPRSDPISNKNTHENARVKNDSVGSSAPSKKSQILKPGTELSSEINSVYGSQPSAVKSQSKKKKKDAGGSGPGVDAKAQSLAILMAQFSAEKER